VTFCSRSQLHAAGPQLEPGEILEQQGAVGGLILGGQKAFVGAGEHGGQFLEVQQVGIERVYEGVDGFFQVGALDVVIGGGLSNANATAVTMATFTTNYFFCPADGIWAKQ